MTKSKTVIKRRTPDALYHFTCSHGFTGISATGRLEPRVHPMMLQLGPLLWLTDQAEPDAEALGLTNTFTKCDRTAYRYVVHTRAALPWSELRARVPPAILAFLEEYRDPSHWWVVRRPLSSSEFTYAPYEVPALTTTDTDDKEK